jgi:signal transduction histidine kinase
VAHLYAIQPDETLPLRAIAHDLNNLLTAISGYGSLLASSDDVAPEARRDAREIVEAAGRAVVLVRQLHAHA